MDNYNPHLQTSKEGECLFLHHLCQNYSVSAKIGDIHQKVSTGSDFWLWGLDSPNKHLMSYSSDYIALQTQTHVNPSFYIQLYKEISTPVETCLDALRGIQFLILTLFGVKFHQKTPFPQKKRLQKICFSRVGWYSLLFAGSSPNHPGHQGRLCQEGRGGGIYKTKTHHLLSSD